MYCIALRVGHVGVRTMAAQVTHAIHDSYQQWQLGARSLSVPLGQDGLAAEVTHLLVRCHHWMYEQGVTEQADPEIRAGHYLLEAESDIDLMSKVYHDPSTADAVSSLCTMIS